MSNRDEIAYWKANLRLVLILLAIWFSASFGCGILFREWMDLNMPNVGGAPFGFWMAQQGSIVCFLILLFTYKTCMNKLDDKFGYQEGGE